MNLATLKCINLKKYNRQQIGAICDEIDLQEIEILLNHKNWKFERLFAIEEGEYHVFIGAMSDKDNLYVIERYRDILSFEYLKNFPDTDFSYVKIPKLGKTKFINLKKSNLNELKLSLQTLKISGCDRVYLTQEGEEIFHEINNEKIFNLKFSYLSKGEINMIINNSKELITKKTKVRKEKGDYIEKLNNKLEEAVKSENYEEASLLNEKISNLDIETIKSLEKELNYCIKTQNFEKAIIIRNQIKELYKKSKSIEIPQVKKEESKKEEVKVVETKEIKPDLSKLERKLQEYLNAELYEMAAEIRDKINKIKNLS